MALNPDSVPSRPRACHFSLSLSFLSYQIDVTPTHKTVTTTGLSQEDMR